MEEVPHGQGTGCLTARREEGGAGQPQYLAAAEIDEGSHGQHSVSLALRSGFQATRSTPGKGRSVTGR
ncbi:hypothetical protein GCM10010384_44970 [Streptomyces djakartensis]|uniref:Uncharacterized protein n=1 Tax=Streptomyces djakartensis TaxID=68193 RepID=A0ABQ3A277_9ACTN|nr:hypothetical protein GCM10010384_44970 [Streptomyces djakartensis]